MAYKTNIGAYQTDIVDTSYKTNIGADQTDSAGAPVEYVDIESTIGLTIGLSGTLDVVTYVDIESTIGLTIGISGTLSVTSTIDLEATIPISIGVSGTLTVGTGWKTHNTTTIMRLVAIGNNGLYYEEI